MMQGAGDLREAQNRPLVILGAEGMLATALADSLRRRGWKWVPLSRADLDITRKDRVRTVLEKIRPAVIVNAAAYNNVDGAESEPDMAFEVNGLGPGNVGEAASLLGALFVHFTTDYIFDGEKEGPYLPEDEPNPLNVYGASKLEGERQVRQSTMNHMIVRTSWLFGPNGKNFVRTMLELGQTSSRINVVDDQTGRPTYTRHLAEGILDLIEKRATGTWHLSNAGHCTWFDFAREIFRRAGLEVEVCPASTKVLNRPALRPCNSLLDCTATYEILGRSLPSWEEALGEYLKEMGV